MNVKKIISFMLVLSLLLPVVSINITAKEADTNGAVCSPDNPEACEIEMPQDLLMDGQAQEDSIQPLDNLVEETSLVAGNETSQDTSSSPRTGEFYEEISPKASNLPSKLENIEIEFAKAEFTNVKGKLTTMANKKPKIIVISKYNCYYCNVLTDQLKTAKKDGKLNGVDVIQVNIEESEITRDAWSYVSYVTNSYSIGTPTIIYINSKNKIIDYSMGLNIKNYSIVDQLKEEFGSELNNSTSYTIKYNGNGATSGTMSNQSGLKKTKSYNLSENKYKRKGYKFAGWALSREGKVKYKNKAEIKDIAGNKSSVTLYAKWTKNKYKITYNLNLKSAKNSSKNPNSYTITTKTTALKAPVGYNKTKYKFKGWYTKKSGGKKVTSIKKGTTGDVKLYARWKKL